MTLPSGTRLGPYSIVAPLGAGGMGEVYRARDARLGRDVAIKVLSQHLSENVEAQARFKEEARTISSLNHPHICTLYDVGREEATDYLVMELVEGETLAERIARGALPIADVLRIGVQITDALDRAHRAGVVHRDLKPGNVMLTKSGAKLMDFGLARATGIAGPAGLGSGTDAALRESPTLATPLTVQGTIVGTLAYLAPEQLEGKAADARSDLWALGCVLYEMATGRRAFVGASQASLIAAIIEREPLPLASPAGVAPLGFERAVKQCLAKDPDERWQSAGDLKSELRWIAGSSSQTEVPITVAARPVGRPLIAWALAAVFAAVAGATLLVASRSGRGPEPLVFRQLNFRREAVFQAVFAAGGETVVYSAAIDGNTPQIFTVRPDYPEPQPLGPRGMHLLAISSQGELAVLIGARYVWHRQFIGTLARMPLGGGAPREILEGVRQADWSPDGSQLAIIREVGGRDRLEYPIGRVLGDGGYMTDVRVSPRGDLLAYFEHPRKWDDRGSVNVVDLAGKKTVLSEGYWSARGLSWSPDGKEVLFSASLGGGSYTVYAVTLAGRRRVASQPPGGLTIQDVARDGRWLATRGDFRYAAIVRAPGAAEDRDLSWLNTSHARALSQDGERLLFAETTLGTNYAVCLRKTDGSPVMRLGEGWPADLSADGKWVLAVVQSRPPQLVIYPTGAGATLPLERADLESYETAQWFRDGKSVLICGNEPGKGMRFYVQETSGGAPRPVTPEGTRDGWPSPDGRLVLARKSEGKYFLFPIAGGEPRPVPGLAEADLVAHWSADGRSVLAYRRAEIPTRLERVFLDTGQRKLFKELAPTDRAGLLSLRGVFVTDDLRSYAYTAYYQVSSLFVSEARPTSP
ncbi:MAG: protein kinase domain-containing protein [Thermoanaerobaculia bacterium]